MGASENHILAFCISPPPPYNRQRGLGWAWAETQYIIIITSHRHFQSPTQLFSTAHARAAVLVPAVGSLVVVYSDHRPSARAALACANLSKKENFSVRGWAWRPMRHHTIVYLRNFTHTSYIRHLSARHYRIMSFSLFHDFGGVSIWDASYGTAYGSHLALRSKIKGSSKRKKTTSVLRILRFCVVSPDGDHLLYAMGRLPF